MEKEKENLVLVSRPIDFLNALELCLSQKSQDFIILLFPNKNLQEKNAIEFLQSHFKSSLTNAKFEKFSIGTSQDFLDLFLFKLYLRTAFIRRKFEYIYFSGGLKGRLLYKNVQARRAVMTDEGTFSLKKFPAIVENGQLFTIPRGVKYGMICRLLGIKKIKSSDDFQLMTMFQELGDISDKIILHNFSHLRSYLRNSGSYIQDDEMIIILGTNPFSHGVNETTYKEKLVQVFSDKDKSKTYLKTHKTFDKSFGLPLLETKLPIEYYFLKERRIPRAVLSFGSTSNVLLHFLFPEIEVANLQLHAN